MFLVKLPRSALAGALDAAMRRAKDEQPEGERDLTALRGKLEQFLNQVLPDSHFGTARDMLDEYPPAGQTYGSGTEDEEDPDEKYPDREQLRKYLEGKGFAEDDIEEALSKMPRNAHEGGMGGRTSEDRRGARDRRRGAMDARSSFEQMFPWASRIKV